jgi:hypothetical protein
MDRSGKSRIMPVRQHIPLETLHSGNASLIEKAKRQADSKTAVLARRAAKRKEEAAAMPEDE